MIKLGSLKRGDTFSFTASFVDGAGQPQAYPLAALRSQVRDSTDKLITELTIAEVPNTPGSYVVSAATTETWPLDILYVDIRVHHLGVHTSSETMELTVTRDITRWEE